MTAQDTLRIEGHESRSDAWEIAVGRSVVYSFLSRALLFPTASGLRTIVAELLPMLRSLSTNSQSVDVALANAIRAHPRDLDELRRAHGHVFTHIENRDCPAHESAYCPGDVFRRADVMADVAAFYRAHGLRVGGTTTERVDHITTELEFLSFLARKEAYAIESHKADEAQECLRSQKVFLSDHLACWSPGFADRLRVVADHPFLEAVGSLLSVWVESDIEWLDVQPSADRSQPQPLPEPDDGLCGATSEGIAVDIRGAET